MELIMNGRRYIVELGASIAAYAAVLVLSITILVDYPPPAAWRPLIALLPTLPATSICWVILRQLHRIDELQRRLQLEALAFAFAGTALMTFSYGFLEGAGCPRLSMFTVWPLMAVLWVVGLFINQRRYQ
jgi:hypothetical protein